MGKKFEWVSDKITTIFGKDSASTTLVLIAYVLWNIAETYGMSEMVFLSFMTIIANIYNNLTKQDVKAKDKTIYDQQKTLFLLGHGIDPDKTEQLYTKEEKKELPPAPS